MSHFGLNNFSAMDFRKTMLLAAAAIFIFSAASCKKDDEKTTTSLSFTGVLDFTIPAYVNPGDEIEVEPRGMSHSPETIAPNVQNKLILFYILHHIS